MADMTLEEALAAATVDEELVTPVNEVLMINPETRSIHVPDSEKRFGVRQDMSVERKYFKCPRIVGDNIDLFEHYVFVNYIPSDQNGKYESEKDVQGYWCKDLAVEGDFITFSWELTENVLRKAGYIAFAVYAKVSDENGNLKTKWHTTIAIGNVLDTLPDGEEWITVYPDIVTQLLERMDAVEKIANPESMQEYVDDYFNRNPMMIDRELKDETKAAPADIVGKLSEEIEDVQGELSVLYTDNLINLPSKTIVKKFRLTGYSSGADIKFDDSYYCIVIPIKASTEYTFFNATNLVKEDGYFWTKIACTSKTYEDVINSHSQYKLDGYITDSTNAYKDRFVFTTPPNANTLIIQVSKSIVPDYMELREGSFISRKWSSYINLYTKEQMDSRLIRNRITCINGECVIKNGKMNYLFKRHTDNTINLDTWRLYSGGIDSLSGFWNKTDVEAPLLEKGAIDFIGGLHGDEVFTSMVMIVDGNVITPTDRDYDMSFEKLSIFVASTMYHCNTQNPCFNRFKELEFEDDTLTICNNYECTDTFIVERATGGGLFSVYKDQLCGYRINNVFRYYDKSHGGISRASSLTGVTFYGDGYTLTIETKQNNYSQYASGFIQDFASDDRPRLKAYLDAIYSESGVTINAGDKIKNAFSIKCV